MTASHTREALVIEASFLRDDLPYFAELLAEVVSQTKYTSKRWPGLQNFETERKLMLVVMGG